LTSRAARAITFLVVGASAIVALSIDLPRVTPIPPLTSLTEAEVELPPELIWHSQIDTLRPGETLSAVLTRSGLPNLAAAAALRSATQIDDRRVQAGMPIIVRSRDMDSLPTEIIFQLATDRLLHVQQTDDGWTTTDHRLPWKSDTMVVAGTIRSNLYAALDESAGDLMPRTARSELAWSIAEIFEYRLDMSRELQQGDEFRVLFSRSVGPGGATKINEILAVSYTGSKKLQAVRYASGSARPQYYDADGRSLRAGFLRAPLEFRRISSNFGMRKHPILGNWRQHAGIDYAANAGTPVRSVADGHVIFAGRRGGYGNVIDVRHSNGIVTRYAHLRGFASSVRAGARVSIGQTIGNVGATGLATAPHLHFEVLVNGRHQDPRVALNNRSGEPLPARERSRFEELRTTYAAALERGVQGPVLALR
jgi:murein DD-endopeptidase MepM/ murein hydrolase activator NlpD